MLYTPSRGWLGWLHFKLHFPRRRETVCWCLRATTSASAFAPRYLTRTAQSHFNNPKRILVCCWIKIINLVGGRRRSPTASPWQVGRWFSFYWHVLSLSSHLVEFVAGAKCHKSCLPPFWLCFFMRFFARILTRPQGLLMQDWVSKPVLLNNWI